MEPEISLGEGLDSVDRIDISAVVSILVYITRWEVISLPGRS